MTSVSKNRLVTGSPGRSRTGTPPARGTLERTVSFTRWESDELLVYWNFYRRTNCRSDVLRTVVVGAVGRRRGLFDGHLRYRLTTTNERR